jgi:hypothetical protein
MGMDLKKCVNVNACYKDLDTGTEITWDEYMSRIIDKLGLENIKPYIPFELDYLKEKLEKDIHLNNTSLISWERAAGFLTYPFKYDVTYIGGGISSLFLRNGINTFSSSEGVCILKETARRLIENECSTN